MENKGFTLIEMIVVMAVFLLIIGTAMGIFISIVQHQRRILQEQELLNQTSYVTEYMSKALRMAKKDTVGDPDQGGCLGADKAGYIYLLTRYNGSTGKYQGIKFINASDNDVCQEFYLDTTDLDSPLLEEIKNNGPSIPLISTKLKINSFKLAINGSQNPAGGGAFEADYTQPRITIYLEVEVKGSQDLPPKKIQTTVSQRNLNVE